MYALQIMILISLIIGIALIIVSMTVFKKDSEERERLNNKLDENFTFINNSVEQINNENTEFLKMIELVFNELEGKRQELLITYKLIDDLRVNENMTENNVIINNTNNDGNNKNVEYNEKQSNGASKAFLYKLEKSKDVFELYDKGFGVIDIAKKLDIGTGQVQLLLDLRKA